MIPKIENSYKNIKNACDRALTNKYRGGIPKEVIIRYEEELEYLKNSPYLDDFEIFRRLYEEAIKSSNLMMTRGTTPGSFIFYLISNSKLNPLPAHFYCSECGHYEEIGNNIFGIDIPECDCPKCGEKMVADGVNLSAIHVWGNNNNVPISFDTNVTSGFYPFAKRVLEELYPNNNVEICGTPIAERDSYISREFKQIGFYILPEGKTIDDYPELIAYLDDGTKCLAASVIERSDNTLKKINLISYKPLDCALYMQNKTGIYYDEIGIDKIKGTTYRDISNTRFENDVFRELIEEDKPASMKMMCNYLAVSHNTYDLSGYKVSPLHSLLHDEAFGEYILYTREDIYDYLSANNIDKEVAYEYETMVRKGQLYTYNAFNKMALKKYEYLLEVDVPKELYEAATRCKYLFPRAHAVSYLLNYAVLAYYMKKDSKSYSYYIKHLIK